MRKKKAYQNGGPIDPFYPFQELTPKKKKFEYKKDSQLYDGPLLPTMEVVAKKPSFLNEWGNLINEESKGAGLAESLFVTPVTAATSLAQLAATKLFTGKTQRPSAALKVNNPIGKFAVDAALDPLNLLGLGLVSKTSSAINGEKTALSTARYLTRAKSANSVEEFNKLADIIDPAILKTVEDFKSRILTPEGRKRAEALNVSVDDLQSIKLKDEKFTDAAYHSGSYNGIGIDSKMPNKGKPIITRHELEHAVQGKPLMSPDDFHIQQLKNEEGYLISTKVAKKFEDLKAARSAGKTELDLDLQNLTLRPNSLEDSMSFLTSGLKETKNLVLGDSNALTVLENNIGAKKYFTNGSSGKEPSAFAAEIQQFMLNKKHIKHAYDEVTPEIIKKAYADYKNTSGNSPLRLFNIMEHSDANYKLLSNVFNKMLGTAPIIALANSSQENKAAGGYLQNNQMKKRKYAGGGQMPMGGDPYAMAAQYVTQIAGDYQSAFNYTPQVGAEKSQKDYNKEIAMSIATKGIIGAVPAILRMNKDKNTIVSGSPGTYQQGGPIQVRPTTNRGSRPNTYVPNLGNPIPQVAPNPLENILVPGLIPNQPINPLLALSTGNMGGTSKSKSKDRFRERANGGSLENDTQLSNSSFQVKDNPNVTDGKHYPEFNANLDHNEVVDSNAKFVFSDDLKLGKHSFADMAKPLYKRVGELESRKDPISTATTEQLNKQIQTLAMTQEELATALGLRDNQGMNRAKGGPLPWVDFNVAEFQQWYNAMPGGDKISADGKWGPKTEAAYKASAYDYMKVKGKNIVDSIGGMSSVSPDGNSYVNIDPVNGKLLPSSIGDPVNIPNKPIYIDTPDGPVDISGLESRDPRQETMRDRERRVMLPDGTQYNPSVDPMSADRTMNMNVPSSSLPNDAMPQFNIGDIMQGIEVGSKFFNIGQGAEKERQLLNTTPVTRTGYDVQPVLQQNQRNYQNAVNSIGTSSANTRRALGNSMYANKLNADNQVLTNYQNMNNEATVNYENRLSQQRQGNIASAFRTNDMNAANRGQYDQAQQNAFTSLGNFGQAMNRRKMSTDMLKLLKAQYPEVYNNVMGGIN